MTGRFRQLDDVKVRVYLALCIDGGQGIQRDGYWLFGMGIKWSSFFEDYFKESVKTLINKLEIETTNHTWYN